MAKDEAAALGVVFSEGHGSPPSSHGHAHDTRVPPGEAIVRQVCDLIKERLPSGTDAAQLERLVRHAVNVKLDALRSESQAHPDRALSRAGGVCCISGKRLLDGGSGPIPVDEKVLVAEAIGYGEDAKLAGGFMAWEKASFTRVVEFPEIGVVIEGELHLSVGGQTLIGKPGDMLYFPKGISVIYSTPSRVKLACVNCIE
jgi:ethanolamine utilization protein EutQ